MPALDFTKPRLGGQNSTWINRGLWLMTIGYAAVTAYGAVMGRTFENVRGPEMLASVVGVLLLLLARRQPSAAATLAIVTVWFQLEINVFIFGTFINSTLLVFPLLVTAAGLLVGQRASAVVGVMSILGVPLAGFLGGITAHQMRLAQGLEGLWLTISTTVNAASAVLTFTVLGSYNDALARTERERARFLSLFESASDGLLGVDSRGVVRQANQAASVLLGQKRESMVGSGLSDILARVGVASEIDYLGAAERPFLLELAIERAAEGPLSIEVSFRSTPVDGAPALLVLRDITQRKLIEQRIGHAQRLESVGELAGGIAHDFNNLLTAIGGSASLIRMLPDPEAKSLADDILEAQRRGSTLTRQLLAFARRDVHQPSELNLRATLEGMRKLIERLLGEQHKVQILPSGSFSINADAAQIEQLVLNLVANARDAMPGGGTVAISVRGLSAEEAHSMGSKLESASQALLEITDTGVGIAPELQAKIFEPFFTTKDRGKGTGLGLAAVQGIVVQNGGSLALESAPGRGSSFRIFFPAYQSSGTETAVQAPQEARPVAATEATAARILLVDDEDLVRQATARVLTRLGYQVVTAANGAAALRHLASGEAVSVVVTDLAMPGISGRELAQRIHAVHPRMPVIYMSGYFEDPSLPQGPTAVPATAETFLQKPFTPVQLMDALRSATES